MRSRHFILFLFCFFVNIVYANALSDASEKYETGNFSGTYEVFKKYANEGVSSAQGYLARSYANGFGVAKNYSEALKWANTGAAGGDLASLNVLGVIYSKGHGVPQDVNRGVEYFRVAAAGGNTKASENLGLAYLGGDGYPIDYVRAYDAFLSISDKSTIAKRNLGWLYQFGYGVPQSYEDAHRWYLKASLSGDSYSMRQLGYLYEDGLGVKENSSEAYEWYSKAAEKGDSISQYKAAAYLIERDVDIDLAKRYLDQSSKSGVLASRFMRLTLAETPPEKIQYSNRILGIYKESASLKEKNKTSSELNIFRKNELFTRAEKFLERDDILGEYKYGDKGLPWNKKYIQDGKRLIKELTIFEKSIKNNNPEIKGLVNSYKGEIIVNLLYEENSKGVRRNYYKYLKHAGQFLVENFPKDHFFHAQGTDLLISYYANNGSIGSSNKEIEEMVSYQLEDTYHAANASWGDWDLEKLCKRVFRHKSSLTLYVTWNDPNSFDNVNAQLRKADIYLSAAEDSLDCIDQEMMSSLLRDLWGVGLFLKDLNLQDLIARQRVVGGKRMASNLQNYAFVLAKKGAWKKAYMTMQQVEQILIEERENIRRNGLSGRVSYMMLNPSHVMVPFYMREKEFEKALPPIRAEIKSNLTRAKRFSSEINNGSMAKNYLDLSEILINDKKNDLAIFILKKALRYDMLNNRNFPALMSEKIPQQLKTLLLNSGRISEAEQVDEMIKKNSLVQFTRGSAVDISVPSIDGFLTSKETLFNFEYEKKYTYIIKKFSSLSDKPYFFDDDLGVEHERAFNDFFDFLTKNKFFDGESLSAKVSTLYDGSLSTTKVVSEEVANVKYYLHSDELFIVVYASGRVTVKKVPIQKNLLKKKIFDLRYVLRDVKSNPRLASQNLYDTLWKPIAELVDPARIKHVVLHLDESLNYVPFAALYDGFSYLASKYSFSTSYLTTGDQSKSNHNIVWNVAGFGVSKSLNNLTPLPSVVSELNEIIKNPKGGLFPGKKWLNDEFTVKNFTNAIKSNFSVIHIATHFQFSPGTEVNSYLQLGDGTKLTLAEINKIKFTNADLVTFSACQSGLGGGFDENGREIAGLSYIARRNGAKSVISSLWTVNDASTALFMKNLYSTKHAGNVTKADSLRAAQISLLNTKDYSHPYYWAPFILSGDWK